jgi:hypothetical protein
MLKFTRSALAVRSPVPLSVRYDSLLVQCCIAAAIYFGPQDAAIAALAFMSGRAGSNSINAAVDTKDPASALEKFYAKKGLTADAFRVKQGGSKWEAKFANMYN